MILKRRQLFQMFKNIKNISEYSSTFRPPSRGDCSIFLRVIFKRYAFSCGKKEWPVGRHEGKLRFNTCNFAT